MKAIIRYILGITAGLLILSASSSGQDRITGFVYDENWNPIPMVTVNLLEASLGTMTNMDGSYTIEGITAPYCDQTLTVQVTAPGYFGTTVQYHEYCDGGTQTVNIWVNTSNDPLIVINTDDSGPGSLRQAILDANANPGKDFIHFNIPEYGVHFIEPTTVLPSITDTLVINGLTQPLARWNTNPPGLGFNTEPKILIEGSHTGAGATGLLIDANDCEIYGLVINLFAQHGISVQGNNNLVRDCFIGVDSLGNQSSYYGNGVFGIQIISANNNEIRACIVSDNGGTEQNPGISISGGSTLNLVAGNLIGTDITGTLPTPNSGSGINIGDSPGNTIGGLDSTDRNIIYGGIQLGGVTTTANKIIGNYCGPDVSGLAAIDQGGGITIGGGAYNNEVGPANVISGNTSHGLRIVDQNTSYNRIFDNTFGLDRTGDNILGNGSSNIVIENASYNIIGGETADSSNIISGSGDYGIHIIGSFSMGNRVEGNYIGTNATGDQARGNTLEGISIADTASYNIIGPDNVISGNVAHGISVGYQTDHTRIVGNLIGTDHLGTSQLGNQGSGINIAASASNTVEGNTICGSDGRAGVLITGANSQDNTITGNYIGTNSLSQAGLGNASPGILIEDDAIESHIENNVISGNSGSGIHITTYQVGNNTIVSNRIGTTVNGDAELENGGNGIRIDESDDNTIGPGNVISGNVRSGIELDGDADDTNIVGNMIGTNASGDGAIPNSDGIVLHWGNANIIGGAREEDRNIISGNEENGIILSPNATRTRILNNYIGTDLSGDVAIPNVMGIQIWSYDNYIGTGENGDGNLIAFNTTYGIGLLGSLGVNNFVLGNAILGNGESGSDPGIFISGTHNTIGGPTVADRNYLYGNRNEMLLTGEAEHNLIEGNYFGTDHGGRMDLAVAGTGISVYGNDNIIRNNLVSGYQGRAIHIMGLDPTGGNRNWIEGNTIGLNANGDAYIPNGHGIMIDSAANTTMLRNVIAGNAGNGIFVLDVVIPPRAVNNLISQNSIYGNGGLGIDLGDWGVTENDIAALDPDIGPNNLQNFPDLDSIHFAEGKVTIKGRLRSESNSTYILEFFSSSVADASGYGEGEYYLGKDTAFTDGLGNALFEATLPTRGYGAQVITATTTDMNGNTSEFSQAIGGVINQVLADMPFNYTLNSEGLSTVPLADYQNAIRSAFETWDAIPTAEIQMEDAGNSDEKYASATDGLNLISFQDDHFPFPNGVLAVTAKTLQISAGGTEAEILDADIIFNPSYILDPVHSFAILEEGDSVTEAFDIQSVATHEIGHVLGMIHSGVYSSTMFFMLGYGTSERVLGADDMAWASYRYQNGDFLPNHGMISGRVTYGDLGDVAVPSSHPPVAGALVLAIDTDTQEKFHAYTDADGNYTVPIYMDGTATDEYWIHIQPLDGDVYGTALNPSNISPYIYSHTMYTDFPNEFYDAQESYNDNPDHGEAIPVSAGGTVTGIDLITNRDLTPPTVVGVYPAPGDTGIAVNPTLVLKFSEPVDIYSFDENSCFLENSGEVVEGEFTILADSTHIMLMKPVEALQYSTLYTLHIDGITDLKDNVLAAEYTSSFTTQAPDTIAPYVYDVIPADEAVQVDVTRPVKLFFSEPMNKSSAETGFSLMTSDNTLVEGDFDWDLDNKEMTYIPDFSLLEGTDYLISLSTQVTDLSGNAMEYDTSFTFSTVDVAAPQILYLGPADGITGITVETPVVVKVSEPLDLSTITSSSFTLTGAAGQVNGTYEYLDDNRTIVFRPDQALQFNQSYTIALSSDISDISNPRQYMQATTATFQTAPGAVVPHILYMKPPFGAVGAQTTIVGSGFDPVPWNNVVSFNGVPATVSKSTLESVTVLVPSLAYSGPVSVTVNGVPADNTFEFDVVDANTDPSYSVLASATSGSRTRAVVIDPNAGYAYVTNWGDNTVTAIDISGDIPVPVSNIQVGVEPMDIDLNPNGTLAYVTNFLSNTVSVIGTDPANTDSLHRVVNEISVGYHPYGVAASSDKKVYVANNESEYVSVIDVDPSSGGFDHVIANVKTGSRNRSLVVAPNAGLILVTGENGVAIIDRDPASPTFNDVIARASAGSRTRHITITADAALALATTEDGVILIIDIFQPPGTEFGNVIASVKTGSRARNITISADAMYVYITNPDDNTVSVYQLDYSIVPGYGASLNNPLGLEHIATIEVEDDPYAIVGHPNSEYILVTHDSDEGGVSKIGIEEESVDVIHTLAELIASVENARDENLVPTWLCNTLLNNLKQTQRRIIWDQPLSAIYHLNRFIRKVRRNLRRERIPTDLGDAWLEAAYRIRGQLRADYLAWRSQLKDSGGADPGAGAQYDPQSLSSDVKDLSREGLLKLENQPNPFADHTRINFEIPDLGKASVPVIMKVYNTSGQVVKTMFQMNMEPGRYSVLWNCDLDQGGMASDGIYLLELKVPDQRKTIRISVMR